MKYLHFKFVDNPWLIHDIRVPYKFCTLWLSAPCLYKGLGVIVCLHCDNAIMDKQHEDIRSDDEDKLKAAFCLINTFMEGNIGYRQRNFHIILIEYADDKCWKVYPYFKTKYRFAKDKNAGLIPDYLHPRL